MVQFLLRHGANVNARTEKGETPLHKAVGVGWTEVVTLLIGCEADSNARLTCEGDDAGATPLHKAAMWGRMDVAKALLGNGAHVDSRTDMGATPLHWAAGYGQPEFASFLVLNGAQINAKTTAGSTPLQVANDFGHTRVSEVLIAHRTDLGKAIGICAVCARPIHADEPFFERRESGMEPIFGDEAMLHYDRSLGVYHKVCAEQAGLV